MAELHKERARADKERERANSEQKKAAQERERAEGLRRRIKELNDARSNGPVGDCSGDRGQADQALPPDLLPR